MTKRINILVSPVKFLCDTNPKPPTSIMSKDTTRNKDIDLEEVSVRRDIMMAIVIRNSTSTLMPIDTIDIPTSRDMS